MEHERSAMDMDFKWKTRPEKMVVVAYWWAEQKGLCCLCGEEMKPYQRQDTSDPDRATVEHLVPKRDGGRDTAGNVRLAHAICNNTLGALWGQNQHRASRGLPPLTEKWALNNAAGNRRAKTSQDAAALPTSTPGPPHEHVPRATKRMLARRAAALDDPRVKAIMERFPGATATVRLVPLDE